MYKNNYTQIWSWHTQYRCAKSNTHVHVPPVTTHPTLILPNKATKRFIFTIVTQLVGHRQLKLTVADSPDHQINNGGHVECFRGERPSPLIHSLTHSTSCFLFSHTAHKQLSPWRKECQSQPLIQRHVDGDMSHMLRRGEVEWLEDRDGGETKEMTGYKKKPLWHVAANYLWVTRVPAVGGTFSKLPWQKCFEKWHWGPVEIPSYWNRERYACAYMFTKRSNPQDHTRII